LDETWIECTGEIWDYEKTFYRVKLKDGTEAWAYPNAGHLTDVGFDEHSGQEIPIELVTHYREDEDAYFEENNI
jgi:2,3-bisphosphoglycerate-independent phosphoglycerate mutase